jgi:hypothetical protein
LSRIKGTQEMTQSKRQNLTRKQRAEFEQLIQLQIREYEDRYYPGGRSVAVALWAAKFPADTDASNRERPLNRNR